MKAYKKTDCFDVGHTDITKYMLKAKEDRIPIAASFELTHRCNFHCLHCYLGSQQRIWQCSDRELDTGTVYEILEQMVEVGTVFLTLTGGDPMIRSDFIEIYEHAVKLGMLVTVFCNGSLITEEIVTSFVRYPPRIVEITFYGATTETFAAITQVSGSYAACIEGIARLKSAQVRVRIKSIIMKLNVHEFQKIRSIANGLDIDFRHDCSLHPVLTGCSDSHIDPVCYRLSPEQAVAVDISVKEIEESLIKLTHEPDKADPEDRLLYRCGAGRTSYHVTPYGQLQPCLMVLTHQVDLRKKTIRYGWESVLKEFSACKARPDFPCITCENKIFCTGCPGAFLLSRGSPEEVDDFYCQYARLRREKSKIRWKEYEFSKQ